MKNYNGRQWNWLHELDRKPAAGTELRCEAYQYGAEGKPNLNALICKFHGVAKIDDEGKLTIEMVFVNGAFFQGRTDFAIRLRNW